ncbi:MAG: histidine kinase [Cereibacter sphaeroides]|uniref:Histidine kinase n=1 Tax=Cereibacter sphaeroides TaxID=1063 RepID=A0A2W5S8S0_CERSP|nr:MAG: histidine kinase [Cereibacter sphaeroides]
MIVQQILGMKPKSGVTTISPTSTLAEAVELLSAHRIGAVVVSTDGRHVSGILSERDVVRELGRHGPSCLTSHVERVMTAKIISCSPVESANDVLQKMTDGRFRHMPVMEGEEMVGLISIGDVVKARLSELSMEKDALEGMIKGF